MTSNLHKMSEKNIKPYTKHKHPLLEDTTNLKITHSLALHPLPAPANHINMSITQNLIQKQNLISQGTETENKLRTCKTQEN